MEKDRNFPTFFRLGKDTYRLGAKKITDAKYAAKETTKYIRDDIRDRGIRKHLNLVLNGETSIDSQDRALVDFFFLGGVGGLLVVSRADLAFVVGPVAVSLFMLTKHLAEAHYRRIDSKS